MSSMKDYYFNDWLYWWVIDHLEELEREVANGITFDMIETQADSAAFDFFDDPQAKWHNASNTDMVRFALELDPKADFLDLTLGKAPSPNWSKRYGPETPLRKIFSDFVFHNIWEDTIAAMDRYIHAVANGEIEDMEPS